MCLHTAIILNVKQRLIAGWTTCEVVNRMAGSVDVAYIFATNTYLADVGLGWSSCALDVATRRSRSILRQTTTSGLATN